MVTLGFAFAASPLPPPLPPCEGAIAQHGVTVWKGAAGAWHPLLDTPAHVASTEGQREAWLESHPEPLHGAAREAAQAEMREEIARIRGKPPPVDSEPYVGTRFTDTFRWAGTPPTDRGVLVWTRRVEDGWLLADRTGVALALGPGASGTFPGLPIAEGDVELPPFLVVVDGVITHLWPTSPDPDALLEVLATVNASP